MNFHLNYPVTSLSASPGGDEACLAAKRGLYIIDLNDPLDSARFLGHYSKWDVCDVQWNPHPSKCDYIASTSNQTILIWNVSEGVVQHILPGHTRAINDFHWSPSHSDVLASISNDSFIHLWDLRVSFEKPVSSLGAWVGGRQVKFNPQNEFILATSHDTDARVWDLRKGSSPLTIITAHMSKVYGIDWSRNMEKELITCAQDGMVKFWDYSQPRNCLASIETGVPIWRARFTPFGNYVVTLPQRKDNKLYLWDCNSLAEPLIVFSGHTDIVKEFVWRKIKGQYQLVTWAKDQHLRLWPVNPEDLLIVRSNSLPKDTGNSMLGKERNSEVSVDGNIVMQIRDLSGIKEVEIGDHEDDLNENLDFIQQKFTDALFEIVDKNPLKIRIFLKNVKHFGMKSIPSSFSAVATAISSDILYRISHFDFSESNLDPAVIQYVNYNLAMIKGSSQLLNLETSVNFLLTGRNVEKESTLIENVDYFFNDIDTPPYPSKDTSDVFIEDVEFDSDSSNNELSLLSAKIAAKTLAMKDTQTRNVPFPRLCQGCFSGGRLVYFFSVLPHPSTTRFNKVPPQSRVHSQKTSAYPKTYDKYEEYRSFLLSRTGLDPSSIKISPENTGSIRETTSNYWLDEEEEDDEELISWRPTVHYPLRRFSQNIAGPTGANGIFLKLIHRSKSRSVFNDLKQIINHSGSNNLPKLNRRSTFSISSVNLMEDGYSIAEEFTTEQLLDQGDMDPTRKRSVSLFKDDRESSQKIGGIDIIDSNRGTFGANVYITQNPELEPISEQMAIQMSESFENWSGSSNECILFESFSRNMGKYELAKIWRLLSCILNDGEDKISVRQQRMRFVDDIQVPCNHFISKIIFQEIFIYLESRRDFQTLAMISLMISKCQEQKKDRNPPVISQISRTKEISLGIVSPNGEDLISRDTSLARSNSNLRSETYRNILPRTVSSSSIYLSPYTATANILAATVSSVMGASNSTYARQNSISYAAAVRNNPETQSKSILKIKTYSKTPQPLNLFESVDQTGKIVSNSSKLQSVSSYSCRYAETLYSWRLWYLRTEILKSLSTTYNFIPEDELRIEIEVNCPQCGSSIPLDSPKCLVCSESKTLKCGICQISCHKILLYCPSCRHGGHIDHYQNWFSDHSLCPTGCGCCCKFT